jgi:radical SAM protein with 4Fe4S-binding SPASM domain
MRLMRQINRWDYLFRHSFHIIRHLTLYKVFNIALNFFEKKYKIAMPISWPLYIKVEPTPLCHLRCLGCNHSNMYYKKQLSTNMQIGLDDFKRIVAPLSPFLLGISLSKNGEPMLHKNISSLIEYAHKKNIAVSFPTNLSMPLNQSLIDELVKSGLDSMFVSLDGATEETYSKYRVGGNFERVLSNVRSIADAKQKYGVKRPKIIWKFIVFDHNKHELGKVKKLYKKLGFDDYELVQDLRSSKSKANRQKYNQHMRRSSKGCFWLWHTIIIGWDGEVFPCCINRSFSLGNAIKNDVRSIWRSEEYRVLRQGFSGKDNPAMNAICRKCMGYELVSSADNKAEA